MRTNRVFPLGLTILVSSLLVACWALATFRSPQLGWDFPGFYIAAHVPLRSLYNPDVFASYWKNHLQPQAVPHWAPYVRLPLFSLPLRYLLRLPYYPALWCWTGLGFASYLMACGLLLRTLNLDVRLFLCFLCFFPATAGVGSGADIGFYFLALTLTFLSLENGSPWLGALGLTLCLYKFNLVALVPLMLLLQKSYGVLLKLVAGAVLVGVSTLYLTSVSAYVQFLRGVPAILSNFTPVGLRGFTQAIGCPRIYLTLATLALVLCCWLFSRLDLPNSFSVALVGALTISPHVTWYDSTLLILPVLLVFAQSGPPMRVLCILVLIAAPLWTYGAGPKGPVGFMHITIETLLLCWFIHKARAQKNVRVAANVR